MSISTAVESAVEEGKQALEKIEDLAEGIAQDVFTELKVLVSQLPEFVTGIVKDTVDFIMFQDDAKDLSMQDKVAAVEIHVRASIAERGMEFLEKDWLALKAMILATVASVVGSTEEAEASAAAEPAQVAQDETTDADPEGETVTS